MKKVKLNGIDRAVIPTLLEGFSGDMLQITIAKELIPAIEIKPDEFSEYDIYMEGNMLKWNTKKILTDKEFDLSTAYIQILKAAVDDLDRRKRINLQIHDTCTKIKDL